MLGKIINKKQIVMFVFVAVALLIAVPIRVAQLIGNTAGTNGFYKETNSLVYLLYALVGVAVIVPLLYNVVGSVPITPFGKSRSRGISFAGMAFAGTLLINFINQTMLLYNAVSMAHGGSLIDRLMRREGITLLLQAVFSMVAAFYILVFAFAFLGGTLNYRNFKGIALFPAMWLACRLISNFLVEINYMLVSQRLLEMLMLVFAIIFFFNFVKLNACFQDGVADWKIFGCGWVCVFLGFLCSVPRMIVWVMGRTELLPAIGTAEYVDFCMGFFVLIYLLKGCVVNNSVKRAQEEEREQVRTTVEPGQHS